MVRAICWRYVTFVCLTSSFYLLYNFHPYYQTAQFTFARQVLTLIYIVYVVIGLPLYAVPLLRHPRRRGAPSSKTLIYMVLIRRTIRVVLRTRSPRWFLGSYRCKVALLSLVVKGFYLPVMTMFLGWHLRGCAAAFLKIGTSQTLHAAVFNGWYDVVFHSLFILDTSIFTIGYAVEASWLGSRIKSVEPTLWGWVVTLICYPPFQDIPSIFLPSPGHANVWLTNQALLDSLQVLRLVLYGIFVWASVALGFKASNLTNRGIVRGGPYRWTRHPAYAAKLLAFWCEHLPQLTLQGALSLVGWNLIYVFRALTEERHLSRDPEYQTYCKQVRFRFIPGLL